MTTLAEVVTACVVAIGIALLFRRSIASLFRDEQADDSFIDFTPAAMPRWAWGFDIVREPILTDAVVLRIFHDVARADMPAFDCRAFEVLVDRAALQTLKQELAKW